MKHLYLKTKGFIAMTLLSSVLAMSCTNELLTGSNEEKANVPPNERLIFGDEDQLLSAINGEA
ncbi:MAG: hypothetical protein LBG28_11700 [Tannerella sp.]|jgi:hypothetical protein|nr:hypothetical protein [Tannerella sp.]